MQQIFNSDVKTKNRLVLKVELLENNILKIKLIYVDHIVLSKQNETIMYSNRDFYFYSKDSFHIGFNSLRFPSFDNYKSCENIHIKRFFSDDDRYQFLKRLNKSLIDWRNNYQKFVSDDNSNEQKKLKFNGEYWVI